MPHPDTPFRICPAGPADHDALDAVFRASVAELCRRHYTTRQLDAWLQRVTPQRWDELLHGDLFFFLARDRFTGCPAGVMSVNARGYVHSLFVHPRYVRMGLGRHLLAVAEQWAIATGTASLWAEVSLTAEPLFRACGFHIERTQEAIVGSERLPQRLMRRDMAHHQATILPACAGTADIRLVWDGRMRHVDLLLLADEDETMLRRYLDRGEMFAVSLGDETVAACIVTNEGNGVREIQNLAVRTGWQRHGIGRWLLALAEERYRACTRLLRVGTGDSPLTIPFYEACGFRPVSRDSGYFLRHYDQPIFEAGRQLTDRVVLEKPLSLPSFGTDGQDG